MYRKIQHGFLNQQQQEEPVERKEQIQIPRGNPPKPERSYAEPEPSGPVFSTPARPPSPPRREPSPPPREPSPPPREPSPPRQLPRVPPSEPEPQLPRARNLLSEGLPPRQDSDEENNNEEEWGEGKIYFVFVFFKNQASDSPLQIKLFHRHPLLPQKNFWKGGWRLSGPEQ